MNYLNLHTDLLRSETYLGAEPLERATWLNLMGWCASQENGGVITGASKWTDRKWQQLCGITKEEATLVSELYEINESGDMVVNLYPIEKEAEVKCNRENGKKGGRPPKAKADKPVENQVVTSHETEEKPSGLKSLKRKGREGKGKERKEKEENKKETAAPPCAQSCESKAVEMFQNIDADWLKSIARSFHSHFEMERWTMANGKDLTPIWPNRLRSWIEDKARREKPDNRSGGSGNSKLSSLC